MNLIYKKLLNVLIFLVSFIVADKCINNKYTALIIAYTLSVCYGIVKNFHLLENFAIANNKIIKEDVSLDEDTVYKKLNSNNIVVKLKPNIKSIISDSLLKKFIDKCKREDDSLVFTRKVKIIELRPTINELSSGKIKKMIQNKRILTKPIVISSDNFIIDGHHRWYSKKTTIDGRNNRGDDDNDDAFIKATIVNIPVDKLIQKIKEFKQDYNEENIGNFEIDHNKLSKANESINAIKNNIEKLDIYIQDLNKMNLV
jgi:hypothetical protein